MANRKEFSILKWIIFPANSIVLAGIIAWFNLSVFGWEDGLPYSAVVLMIGIFSIIINKYTESENRGLAKAAFVFEIFLTAALVANATYSMSVQRKMSVAKMGESSQVKTIEQIGKLKGARTQREAVKKIETKESAQTVFGKYEDVLFWIMAGELALYAISAFTLFAMAKLIEGSRIESSSLSNQKRIANADEFPSDLEVSYEEKPMFIRSDSRTTDYDSRKDSGFNRKRSLEILRDHLKEIAPKGKWFKADLIEGGVSIRLYQWRDSQEYSIARTKQSDKLLMSVEHPKFRSVLTSELKRQGFSLQKERIM
jgi:hypothetical protein